MAARDWDCSVVLGPRLNSRLHVSHPSTRPSHHVEMSRGEGQRVDTEHPARTCHERGTASTSAIFWLKTLGFGLKRGGTGAGWEA
jgi:hypothetical protein